MINFNEMGETMTVAELMETLSELPEHLPVITEGCDCYGTAAKVTVKLLHREYPYPDHYTLDYINELEAPRRHVVIERSK